MNSSKWLLGSCAGVLLSATSTAFALNLTVNTTADLPDQVVGDGLCQTSAGTCSLRAAVMEANKWDVDVVDTITLPAGNYVLTRVGKGEEKAVSGDLDILSAIIITGAGASQTTIDGNLRDRIFDVYSAGNLTLDGVTLTKGELLDEIWNGATPGGDYTAVESINGGAVRVQGSLIVRNSVIVDNGVQGDGGALHVMFGAATIENTTIDANKARGFGSGIFVQEGELRIIDSVISNNTAPGFPSTIVGGGLAIFNAKVQIEGSTFDGNKAFRDGGAIYYAVGDVNIINSTFSNNVATRFGGAIYVSGGSNSGGFNWFQSIRLSNVTIAYNRASAVSNDQNITHPAGGGIFLNNLGKITMSNTLLSDNYGDDCYVSNGGEAISNGFNLDSDGSCGLAANGDLSNVGATGLLPLQENGGPTPTHGLAADSPAIDSGDDGVCADIGRVDQRGYVRPVTGCDIGAFELEGDSGIAPPPPPAEEPANNLPPVALDMVISLASGGSYVGVLNASDPNDDRLSFQIIDQVGFPNASGYGMGILVRDDTTPAGSFIYRPDVENPVSADMFTYRACDQWGLCSNTAQVRVLIDQTQQASTSVSLEVVPGAGGSNVDDITVLSPTFLEAVTGGIDYTYPVGGLTFSVDNLPLNVSGPSQVTVVLEFPLGAEVSADAVVRKLDKSGVWHTLPSTQPQDPVTGLPLDVTWSEVDVPGRTISLHLVDNDNFDHDPATGVIDDPVALAVPVPSAGGGLPDSGAGTEAASNSGGGAGAWLFMLSGLWWLRRRFVR